MSRRNVLLILTDQLRYDRICRSPGNDALYCTPNIDTIRRQGITYDRAYTASALCSPSRASIFTGRRPTHHGLTALGLGLDPAVWTMTRGLREAGYYCHLVGKSHLQPYAFEGSGWTDIAVLDDSELMQRRAFEMLELHARRYRPLPEDYYGFHSVDLAIGHGDDIGGHFPHWLSERRSITNQTQTANPTGLAAASRYDEQTHPSAFVAERVQAAIERCSRSQAPFFLVASFPDPHHPFRPPRRHYERTADLPVRLPDSFSDAGTVPRHLAALLAKPGIGASGYDTWSVTAAQLTEYIRAEAACINFLDECIGRILASLREAGLDENTAIMFTSDHGDMFGDHRLMYKHGTHYDGTLHVPLVVRSPGIEGGTRVTSIVSTLDIAPTVCALAGVAMPRGGDGTQLPGSGAVGTPRQFAIAEEDIEGTHSTLPAGTRIRSIISDIGRLTLYSDRRGEFYLRAGDPGEQVDRFDDPVAAEVLTDHLEYAAWTLFDDLPRAETPRYAG